MDTHLLMQKPSLLLHSEAKVLSSSSFQKTGLSRISLCSCHCFLSFFPPVCLLSAKVNSKQSQVQTSDTWWISDL